MKSPWWGGGYGVAAFKFCFKMVVASLFHCCRGFWVYFNRHCSHMVSRIESDPPAIRCFSCVGFSESFLATAAVLCQSATGLRPCMSAAVICHLAFAFVTIIFLLKIQCSPITDSAVDMNNKVPFSGIYYWGGSTHFQVATVSMSLYIKTDILVGGGFPIVVALKFCVFSFQKVLYFRVRSCAFWDIWQKCNFQL